MKEFKCERCGINVMAFFDVPPETLYCLECRFVESIDDPEEKRKAAEFVDRRRAEFFDRPKEDS